MGENFCLMRCTLDGVPQMECRLCRPARFSRWYVYAKRIWLFLRIVFREWHGRIWPKTAWEISCTVWGKHEIRREGR